MREEGDLYESSAGRSELSKGLGPRDGEARCGSRCGRYESIIGRRPDEVLPSWCLFRAGDEDDELGGTPFSVLDLRADLGEGGS